MSILCCGLMLTFLLLMGLREYLALSSTLTSRVIVFNWNIQFADRGMIV